MTSSAIDIYGSNFDTFKNKVINGNFDIWQRGRGVSGPFFYDGNTAGDEVYLADRWFAGNTGSYTSYGFTAERAAFDPNAFGPTGLKIKSVPQYHMNFQDSFDTVVGDHYSGLGQKIEDVRTLSGKQATVSFWAKGSTSGTCSVRLSQNFGSDGSSQVDLSQRTFRVQADAWNRYVLSFVIPGIAGNTMGTQNDDYLELFFHTKCTNGDFGLSGGTDINYPGVLSLSEVQIEEGTATQFDKRNYATELMLCQRFFEIGMVDSSSYVGASGNRHDVTFSTHKKAYSFNFFDYVIPVAGSSLDVLPSNITSENYSVRLNFTESTNVTNVGFTGPVPDGFSITYDRTPASAGTARLNGIWVVDAEL